MKCEKCSTNVSGDRRFRYSPTPDTTQRVCRQCLISLMDAGKAHGCITCNGFVAGELTQAQAEECLFHIDRDFNGCAGVFHICPECVKKRIDYVTQYKLFACASCERLQDEKTSTDVSGIGKCCAGCAKRAIPCSNCNTIHIYKSRHNARQCVTQPDGSIGTIGISLCDACRSNETTTCTMCGNRHIRTQMINGEECLACSKSEPFDCEICHGRVPSYRKVSLKGVSTQHKEVCDNCYQRHGGACRNCGTLQLPLGAAGHHRHFSGRHYCNSCVNGVAIPDWRYTGRITPLGEGDLFYGVENENEFNNQSGVDKFRKYYADKLDKCWLVHDGTLQIGVEVAFQPMTFDYWMGETGDDLVMDTRRLVNKDYDLQGVHIHMSKDAFTTRHLYRFVNFLTVYKPLLAFVAGRDVGLKRDFWQGEKVLDIAKEKSSPDKYKFINAKPKNTVEIRLFKGAFHQDTVRMYIQFLDAVFHYTKDIYVKDVRLEDFLYFSRQETKYRLFNDHVANKTAEDFLAITHDSVDGHVEEDDLPDNDKGVLPSNTKRKRAPRPRPYRINVPTNWTTGTSASTVAPEYDEVSINEPQGDF